ncbi:MAG: stage V sporulation protein AB [Lachnospiraceae bacterium]|nr:stage V sporulation protein AB [Lachnospiraceae bacterium]
MRQILLIITGFSSGFLVAGGVVALMVGLGILSRFIGISHTAKEILWYEDAILLGTLTGTIVTVFDVQILTGEWLLAIGGIFIGIFVGGWIMALEEVVDIFPIYSRRLGITRGVSWIVIAIAIGKAVGNMIYFYRQFG